jgi:phosphoglycerate dehydrogenase-like enzyme
MVEVYSMKIAFRHPKGEHAAQLFRGLAAGLVGQELLSWPLEETAPANDIRVLLALGPVRRAQLEPLSKLELVQTVSAGFESIDVNAASELGIWVSNAPAGLTGNAASVAEFAVMLLIGASRHLVEALRSVSDQTPVVSTSNQALSGKTICIVGLGSIGRNLVDRLRPFGLTIVATNEDLSHPIAGITVYPAHELKRAVTNADYVVICVPGSRQNENLVDASVLGAMKCGAILVNVARGNVVDEFALCAALSSGQLSAVGLDVLRTEPARSDDPLLAFPQALITPHIAGDTDLTLSGTLSYIAQVVQAWDAGIKPQSVINQPQNPRKIFL